MNKRYFGAAAVALFTLTLGSTVGSAAPVLWTLENIAFDDGGTAIGSFQYDAGTGTYSNINISATAGSVLPGSTLQFLLNSGNPNDIYVSDTAGGITGSHGLSLFHLQALTDAGGTVPITLGGSSFEATCTTDGSCNHAPDRLITARSLTAATTPEPGTLALIPLSLLAIAGIKRRFGQASHS